MAGFHSCKMLLCVVLLYIPTFVTSASACSEGKVADEEGKCCTPELMNDDNTCFEPPSEMSMAAAFTLIGSFVFLISLLFALNWPDDDMRKYAYQVISDTVSIFSAVLMFQCLNGLVEDWIIDHFGFEGWWEILIDFLHMIIWYTIMQLVVAVVSGALQPQATRDRLRYAEDEEQEKVKQKVEVDCECYGIVLAHLTGFASINLWTGLQQQELFRSTPLMTLLPLPVALVGQVCLQRITDFCREKIIFGGDGKKDFFEDKWDEYCEEAENDVMGLTCSVILVNTIRYAINGMADAGVKCLPNQEQKEEGPHCEELIYGDRTWSQVITLFMAGFIFAVVLFMVKLLSEKFFPEGKKGMKEKHEEEEEEEEEGEEEEEEEEEPIYLQVVKRIEDSLVLTLSMAFSWCAFHANRQLLTTASPGFLGEERNACTLAVILALEVTYAAWMIMCILDFIADLPERYTPKAVDDSIKQVINALSVLIGFGWEQTFDEAVDSLANSFREPLGEHAPALAKFAIGSICCTIVFLAWKWYILELVVKKGWMYHIVFSRADMLRTAQTLAKTDPFIKQHVLHTLENSDAAAYKALPGEETGALHEKNRQLVEKLQQAELEKTKLQNLLNHHMESMLESFKAMNDTVTRIEME